MDYNFCTEENRIYLKDEHGKIVAEIDFREIEKGVYDIYHTYVDENLRGMKIASKLVKAAFKEITKRNSKVVASCSYAKKWLEKII